MLQGMTAHFADHFSSQAGGYARFRPSYPPELLERLAGWAPERSLAWDCATGNGQVAVDLAAHVSRVVGTEPSLRQLAHRRHHERVRYVCSTAEASGLGEDVAALVTVGQALHWFAGEPFFREVRRVARPGAVIAAWGYGLCKVGPEVDAWLNDFYDDEIGPFWPPERRFLDEEYATLPFPFPEIDAPGLALVEHWTFEEFLGYLSTWSAVQRYRASERRDPLEERAEALRRAWGDETPRRAVVWPLYLRVGRV